MNNCRFLSILERGAKIALSLALSVAQVRGASAETLLDFDPAESSDTETTFFGTTRGMVENTSEDVWHQAKDKVLADYNASGKFVDIHTAGHQDYNNIAGVALWTALEINPSMVFYSKFSFSCNGEYNRHKYAFGFWKPANLAITSGSELSNQVLEKSLEAGVRLFCNPTSKEVSLALIANGAIKEEINISSLFSDLNISDNSINEIEWHLDNGIICDVKVNGVAVDGSCEVASIPSESVFAVGAVRGPHIYRLKVDTGVQINPKLSVQTAPIHTPESMLTATVTTLGLQESADLYLSYGLPGGERTEQFVTTVTKAGVYSVVPDTLAPNTDYEYNFILKWNNGASEITSKLGTFRTWRAGGQTAIKFDWIDDGNTAQTFYGTKRGLSVNVPGGSWSGANGTEATYQSSEIPVRLVGERKVAAALPLCTAGGIPGVPTAFRVRAAFSFDNSHYGRNELDIGLWDEAAVAKTTYTGDNITDYSLAQGMDFGIRVFSSSGSSYNHDVMCVHLGLIANKELVTNIDLTDRFAAKHIIDNKQRHEIEYEVDVAAGTLGNIKFDGEAVEGSCSGVTFAIDSHAKLGLGVLKYLYLHELEVWTVVEHGFGVAIGNDAASSTVSAEVSASVDMTEGDTAELWVAWGPAGGALTNRQRVGDITSAGECKAVITGLMPEQDYDYQFTLKKSGEETTSEVASFRTLAVTLDNLQMTQLEDGSWQFKVDLNGLGVSGAVELKLKLAGANGYAREFSLGTVTAGGTYTTEPITLDANGAFDWWFELADATPVRSEARPIVSAVINSETLKPVLSFKVTDDGEASEVMYGTARGLAVNLTESEWLKPKTNMTDDNAQYEITEGYALLTTEAFNWSAALPFGNGVYAKRLPQQLSVSTTFSFKDEFYSKNCFMVAFFPADKLGASWPESVEANAALVAVPDAAVRILTRWEGNNKYTFVEVIADGRVCSRTDISYLFPNGVMTYNQGTVYAVSFDIDTALGVLCNLRIDGTLISEAIGTGVNLSQGCSLGFSSLRANNRIQLRTLEVKGVLNTGLILNIR